MSGSGVKPVRVGLLDSGVSDLLRSRVTDARAFHWQPELGRVEIADATQDKLGHGTVLADTLLQAAPDAGLLVAQVFNAKGLTTPAQVAAALDWLVVQGAQVINISLGLRADREVLRLACQRALAHGVILVGASPAQGDAVYPSAYSGVLRATGDARCRQDEVSFLNSPQADFGACVHSSYAGVSGASVATAYLSGHIAHYVAGGGKPPRCISGCSGVPVMWARNDVAERV